ncbi:MAG: hypothetical protein ACO3T7_15755, partial [Pseudomonadales bacterium]
MTRVIDNSAWAAGSATRASAEILFEWAGWDMALELKDKGLLKESSYIDGAWVDADSGETVSVVNPSTGETVAK